MFGFSSGGSSNTSHFSANVFTNSPVSFGGSITQGDITTGATTQTGSATSTGGTTSQSLDLSIPPIPALLMNLDTENTGFMAFGKSSNDINFRALYDYAQQGGDALAAIGIPHQLQLLVDNQCEALSENLCHANAACSWCTSFAVRNKCNTVADAATLPSSIFICDNLA